MESPLTLSQCKDELNRYFRFIQEQRTNIESTYHSNEELWLNLPCDICSYTVQAISFYTCAYEYLENILQHFDEYIEDCDITKLKKIANNGHQLYLSTSRVWREDRDTIEKKNPDEYNLIKDIFKGTISGGSEMLRYINTIAENLEPYVSSKSVYILNNIINGNNNVVVNGSSNNVSYEIGQLRDDLESRHIDNDKINQLIELISKQQRNDSYLRKIRDKIIEKGFDFVLNNFCSISKMLM